MLFILFRNYLDHPQWPWTAWELLGVLAAAAAAPSSTAGPHRDLHRPPATETAAAEAHVPNRSPHRPPAAERLQQELMSLIVHRRQRRSSSSDH